MGGKTLATILAAAVVAAAVSAATIAITGEGDPPKQPASDALQPDQLTKTPVGQQLAQDMKETVEYGRFRILPPGSVPRGCPPPGGSNDVKISESNNAAELDGLALDPRPAFMFAGWSLSEVHIERTLMADGRRAVTLAAVTYEAPRQFPMTIVRRLVDPGCTIERVGFSSETNQTRTLTEVDGVKAVVTHQTKPAQVPLEVSFVQGAVVTSLSAVAVDLDDLLRVAGSLNEVKP